MFVLLAQCFRWLKWAKGIFICKCYDMVCNSVVEYVDDEGIRWTIEKCRPNVSLMNFYSISWKPRNNHFNRHTDIKPKGKPPIISVLLSFVLQGQYPKDNK